MDTESNAAPVEILLENHRAFLRYLERRVGDPALAEDILQDAFAKVVARPDQAPTDEAIVPWFYRNLRNAAIDQFRRRGAAGRAYEAFARELDTQESPSAELEAEICACVSRLAATLKPEYAEALEAIEVAGTPVKTFAEQKGLSSSNAGVRVFRAREADRDGDRTQRRTSLVSFRGTDAPVDWRTPLSLVRTLWYSGSPAQIDRQAGVALS